MSAIAMIGAAAGGVLAIVYAALIALNQIAASGQGRLANAPHPSRPSSWPELWWESLGGRDATDPLALGALLLLLAAFMRKIVLSGLRD